MGLGILAALAALCAALMLFALLVRRRVEAAVPPLGRFVQVGDTRLHVVEQGSGPPLVLVHGLGAQLKNFTYALVGHLAPHFRVICVDRPGCGYSTRPAHVASSLLGQADTIAQLIRAIELEKPVIVGHSYGGAVALALALEHPDTVGGLALIAPLTHPQTVAPAAFRGLVILSSPLRKLMAWTFAIPVSMAAGGKILELVFSPDKVPADFAAAGGGLLSLRPGQFFSASSDLVSVNDDLPGMVQRYGSIRVPVGVLYGRSDAILSPAAHGLAMQSKVEGSTVTLVEGGHMLPISAPGPTAQWIMEFARRAARGVPRPP